MYYTCATPQCVVEARIFTASSRELAVCPRCGKLLYPVTEEFDSEELEARQIIDSTDRVLASTYYATRRENNRHLRRICVAEIYKRAGMNVDPEQWATEQRKVWDA